MIDLTREGLRPHQRAPARIEAAHPKDEPKPRQPKTRKLVFRKPAHEGPSLAEPVEVDRPYGERGDFEKVTVTLPADVRDLLLDESIRRKKKRSADWPIAAIVREAIAAYLNRSGQ